MEKQRILYRPGGMRRAGKKTTSSSILKIHKTQKGKRTSSSLLFASSSELVIDCWLDVYSFSLLAKKKQELVPPKERWKEYANKHHTQHFGLALSEREERRRTTRRNRRLKWSNIMLNKNYQIFHFMIPRAFLVVRLRCCLRLQVATAIMKLLNSFQLQKRRHCESEFNETASD